VSPADFARRRAALVDHLRREGIRDQRVLAAIGSVPRELFVPEELADEAYDDRALPIAAGQTISQPFVVARMTELLDPRAEHRALEIGTGSGYQTAILARLVSEVVSIERHAELADEARARLDALGLRNVTVVTGDGTAGHAERAPYDRILVTAATPRVPAPLARQCAPGGRIVAPVGSREVQELMVFVREDGLEPRRVESVKFVPLIGEHGFKQDG
jgi:protein-L-isoaspartate(D-aspartate) O-methyltransferase